MRANSIGAMVPRCRTTSVRSNAIDGEVRKG